MQSELDLFHPHMLQLVDNRIFFKIGNPISFSQELPVDLALSPVKSKISPAKRSTTNTTETPNKKRAAAGEMCVLGHLACFIHLNRVKLHAFSKKSDMIL